LEAAGLRVQLVGSSGLMVNPSSLGSLNSNSSDLRPRNHIYVSEGATLLGGTFPLDTSLLADGYHELEAVAYEGTHIRTETVVRVPVQVQNTTVLALLIPLDLPDTAAVSGTYHIQVTCNASNVSSIRLCSTGGVIGQSTNSSSATFTFPGSMLQAGLHPFYALVDTAAGARYRTETRWSRFVH
jgi:hypothetical protein